MQSEKKRKKHSTYARERIVAGGFLSQQQHSTFNDPPAFEHTHNIKLAAVARDDPTHNNTFLASD
ncbi:hypothetical protein T4E_1208 [Trichinella pseudospiralis]|uniref:Uncharacterized protein n=1 Tax=Trichinella pseudospiralis TaxID=6337 RepID=A0A0V0XFE9_TRIPS|nr:hypothetical protein T4E_1208 [Trichinella pseudospiralis]